MRKNRLIYLSLLILAFIFAYFDQGLVPSMYIYILLMLPFFSLLYTTMVYSRFKYAQTVDQKRIIKGDLIHYTCRIYNEDFLYYPPIKLIFSGEDILFSNQLVSSRFVLPPRGHKDFIFQLQCKYRGSYKIGLDIVEIDDFFGLFKLKYTVQESKILVVYPSLIQLSHFSIAPNYISDSNMPTHSSTEDTTTMSDIRPYAYGDSLKKIHWKLSSKFDHLMVKNFESTVKTNGIFMLDLKKNPLSPEQNLVVEDKLIEAGVSLIHYCLNNWIPIYLVYYHFQLCSEKGSTPLDFDKFYTLLANVQFSQSISIGELLDIYLNDFHVPGYFDKTNIMVLTCNLDSSLYTRLYQAKLKGYDVTLIYVSTESLTGVPDTSAEQILLSLSDLHVTIYQLDIHQPIETILEGSRHD